MAGNFQIEHRNTTSQLLVCPLQMTHEN